jgi:ATP-dependent helicase/nuclease subunit A
VFIAGLSKQFNMMDLRKSYLLDKDYGFAAKYVNSELRITYPSLPQLAFKKKKQLELIAEEMRVLYVALTRAKEKLYLIASINDAEKTQQNWESNAAHGDWLLKDYVRAGAKSYLDWIGPSLVRHRDSLGAAGLGLEMESHPSNWSISVIPSEELAVLDEEEALVQEQMLEHVQRSEKVGIVSEFYDDIKEQLEWEYPEHEATVYRSKQSVSELKRQYELKDEQSSTELLRKFKRPITKRPTFMQEKSLTPAERGTITHLVMQHIDLSKEITIQSIQQLIIDLIQRELLTEEQKEAVDPETIVDFFDSEIGQRMQRAESIRREVPFTMSLPAKEAYSDWAAGDEEVLIQGVIDCIFEDEQGLVLLDYKTDTITGRFASGYEGAKGILADRYRMQIQLYTRAVEGIMNKKVTGRYLFFFDGSHLLEVLE